MADDHYADTEPKGGRYYRDSATKLAAAVKVFQRENAAFVVELGDLVNAGPSKAAELGYLKTVCGILGRYPGPKHFVLGNHCVEKLTAGFLRLRPAIHMKNLLLLRPWIAPFCRP